MRDERGHLPENKSHSKVNVVVPAFCAALVTFLVFLPALKNDFVNWDDYTYVIENLNIRSLDMAFVKWALTSLVASNWHPLTMLSHAIDFQLFGLDPWGHHLTSIVMHALNTSLVFILVHILYTRFAERGGEGTTSSLYAFIASIAASLLFGLHPLHVESVVWISERKDLLCGFFYLLSVLFYLGSTKRDPFWKGFYLLSLFSLLLALLSKPMAVSLPFVLLIIDYFPLERLRAGERVKSAVEKVPFFLLAFAFSILTLLSQRSTGAVVKLADTSIYERLLVSARAYSFYLYKTVLPVELAPLYPFPTDISLGLAEFLIPVFIFIAIAITMFIFFLARRFRLFSTAWAFYVITLLPVIGIVRVGQQAAADRYTYLPVIAPFILVGLLLAFLARRFRSKGAIYLVLLFVFLLSAVLSTLTIRQSSVWKDSLTLWSHEIEIYPMGSFMAYTNRGSAYEFRGEFILSLTDYTTAIELNPKDANLFVSRGDIYYKMGDYENAKEEYQKAIEIKPEHTGAHISLGVIAQDSGKLPAAIERFTHVLSLDSESGKAYLHRGIALVNMGKPKDGLYDIERAIEFFEESAEAYNARALAHYNLRSYKEAKEDYKRAIEKDPAYAEAYYNQGLLYSTLGDSELARESYEKAKGLGLREAGEALKRLR